MFKLFKNVKQQIVVATATVEKIHSEFDSASDKILKKAKDIISKNKCADKGSR